MTLLITSISVDSLADIEVLAAKAWEGGSDAVELRMDALRDPPDRLARYLSSHPGRTWVVTCRSDREGGRCGENPERRVSMLEEATRSTGVFVDFEFSDWQSSQTVREGLRRLCGVGAVPPSRLILSKHDFAFPPADRMRGVEEMLDHEEVAAAKVAYTAEDIGHTFDALDVLHRHRDRLTAICMGEAGLWTRVLAKKLGGFASYCSLDGDHATAPGQLTLAEMTERYRWSSLNARTKVFGVVADPVAHSMSPALFNRWFADADINAVYLPLRVRGGRDGLRRFLDGCCERPWLHVEGLSVTLPHKESALRWVRDGADTLAASIGAVNTLALGGDKPAGHNTDCRAAIDSMTEALGCSRADLAGLRVDVLGTGGAARAVVAGLRECGCKVTVFGRSPERTRKLAERFDCTSAAWEARGEREGEVLIHSTSVGMWPDVHASPMPVEALEGCRLVFDLVYRPWKTELLRRAERAGCQTLNGLDMFVRQAAMQFERWIGKRPDVEPARDRIAREIQQQTELGR